MKSLLTYLTVALTLVACESKKTARSETGEHRAEASKPTVNAPASIADAAPRDASKPLVAAPPETSVLIPGGPYTSCVNCPKKHQIVFQIDAFRIAQSEVTSDEYQACVDAGACRTVVEDDKPDRPVVGVTWADADRYCRFAGGRLPTATEWRKAAFPAKPGQDGVGPMLGSKYDPCMVLVIGGHHDEPCRTGVRQNKPDVVSAKNPDMDFNNQFDRTSHGNALVFDLFGNVAEWVSDWYSVMEFLQPTNLVNPVGADASDSTEKTICGGSFSARVGLVGGACRPLDPLKGYPDVGFRCAWNVPTDAMP